MKLIAKAIGFVIYSNIFIALCISAYTAKTSLLLYGNNGNSHVTIIAFCFTFFFYSFHRINKKDFLIHDEEKESRNNWMSAHLSIYYVLIVISLVTAFIELFYMPFRAWIVFLPVCLLGLGYTFPVIIIGKEKKRLRDISWLKPFWIAFAFSWFTTFLPVTFIEPVSSILKPEVLFIFCRSFLFIFAICIPFDIRDMHFDKLRGVHTFPVSFGARTSIYIAITVLWAFISLICIQFLYFKLEFWQASALFCSGIITILLLPFANSKKAALLYPLLYDGSMLLQWVLIVAFTNKNSF